MISSNDFARFLLESGQDDPTMANLDDPSNHNESGMADIFSPVPQPRPIQYQGQAQTQAPPQAQAQTATGTMPRGGGSPGYAASSQSPGAGTGAGSGDPIVNYIREAARKRGIDPEIAVRVAAAEGGRSNTVNGIRVPDFSAPWLPAIEGSFATGHSWWPYQLHYGGAGTPYAHYGTTAGMGNDFTAATGYQPGDPAALNASIDFALDQALKTGWGRWYGAKAAGIGNWDGLPR